MDMQRLLYERLRNINIVVLLSVVSFFSAVAQYYFFNNYKYIKMDFGQILIEVKAGKKVARKGWNGKGMWLSYLDPYFNDQFDLVEKDIEGTFAPYIGMKTADNKYVPWLASQTDILADDWMVLS